MEKVYEFIEKIPEKFRYLAVFGIAVIVIALYVFLVRFPTIDKLNAKDAEYEKQHKVYLEKKAIADDLQNWQLEVQRLQAQLLEALNQLPTELDTDQLLINIPNIAKKNALTVTKFDIAGESGKGTYAEIPMKISFTGTYQGSGSFAQEIGDQPRIMAMRSFKMKRTKEKTSTEPAGSSATVAGVEGGVLVAVDAELVTYRFVEGGAAPKADGPKGKGGKAAAKRPAPSKPAGGH